MNDKINATTALLQAISRDYAPAAFANSLGAEDMVLMDLVANHAPAIEVFTLDTGRLPEETYALLQRLKRRYPGVALRIYYPRAEGLQDYAERHGPNAFYDGLALRRQCCHIRKVEPLARALIGKRAWITGLRREQAVTRQDLPLQQWDDDHQLPKFNPLADWSADEVWSYIHGRNLPYNALHDRGYPSIGCAPCTRAVTPGEDIRAGRWWWEQPESKECGLHASGERAGVAGQGA